MGVGNQFFRNYDGEAVTTFYFEGCDFDEAKADIIEQRRENIADELRGLSFAGRRRMLMRLAIDGQYPVRVSDERVYDTMNDWEMDDIDNVAYEIAAIEGFTRLDAKQRRSDERIVAGFRDSGFIICESDCCVIAVSDNESNTAIAAVPTFTRSGIEDEFDGADWYRDEAEADMIQTMKRADATYEITETDIERRAEELREGEIDKALATQTAKYELLANAAMRKVHEHFTKLYARNGAWMYSMMPTPEEMDANGETYYG